MCVCSVTIRVCRGALANLSDLAGFLGGLKPGKVFRGAHFGSVQLARRAGGVKREPDGASRRKAIKLDPLCWRIT